MAEYHYPYKGATDYQRRAIWNKARSIPGKDPALWRADACGHQMYYHHHGELSIHGWEIDHIIPRARGGGDELSNLQPLWWKHNRQKGDSLYWACPATAA